MLNVLQIKYHELETFNGDSSSLTVQEPEFFMYNLQPAGTTP